MNGQLGAVAESRDGLLALVLLGAASVNGKFETGKPYIIYGPSSLDDLGVTESNNARLVELVREFYTAAPEGTPLYIAGFTGSMTEFCNKDTGSLVKLVEQLKGDIRGIVLAGTVTDEATEGIADDVIDAVPVAQLAAEHCADALYAPVFVILEGRSFESAADLPDMTKSNYNRVAIMVGDTKKDSKGAAVGLLAGRIASAPIQRNIAAVIDGELAVGGLYLGDKLIDESMDAVRTAHDKGYLVPRIHMGRAGYYFADDTMCCAKTDDYAHLTARRTIDKAARIAYDTLIDFLQTEVEVNDDGTLQAPVVKSWQAEVESAIDAQMTASGELSAVGGSGCRCLIDAMQNVRSTGQIVVSLSVRPFGYARDIVCKLGILANNA